MNDWSLINICTEDEYLNIDSCIEEYAKDHDDLPVLVRDYYDDRFYGNISGEYDVLASFAMRYRCEPVIKAYLGRYITDRDLLNIDSMNHDSTERQQNLYAIVWEILQNLKLVLKFLDEDCMKGVFIGRIHND